MNRFYKDLRGFIDRNNEGWRGLVLYTVMGVAAALVLNTVFGFLLGTSFPVVTVSSASMVPQLQVGDLAIIQGQDDYALGDIIVFKGWESRPIIHRIVAKYDSGDVTKASNWDELTVHDIEQKAGPVEKIYITRGDANPSCDQCAAGRPPARQEDIYGKTVLRVPYLGWVKLLAVRYVINPLTA